MPSSNKVRKVTSENYPTDAGREGELIFRLVYEQAGCKKPVSRLWLSSMEDNAIREGFANLKPSTEYDALYQAALCRERADWMVGIPLTQEEFTQKLADRNEIQSYRMKQFQQSGHDCYLVMQLQQDADPALRFAAMRYLNKQNIAPSVENYEILYRGNLPEGKRSVPQAELLEQLYQKFNFARPTDYHGHSLSVSDVIMLNQDGKISAHYVDSIGFKELPGFLDKKPERLSVLQNLKEKCDAPECNPTVYRKVRDAHEL